MGEFGRTLPSLCMISQKAICNTHCNVQGQFLVLIGGVNLLEKARHGGTGLHRNVQSLSRKLKEVAYDLILLQHGMIDLLCVLRCELSRTIWGITVTKLKCIDLVDRWKVLCDDLLPPLTHDFARFLLQLLLLHQPLLVQLRLVLLQVLLQLLLLKVSCECLEILRNLN